MNLVLDESAYNKHEIIFAKRLVECFRSFLEDDLPDDPNFDIKLTQEQILILAEKLSFCAAAQIDGCDVIGGEPEDVVPLLAYKVGAQIIVNPQGSEIHGLVMGHFDDELAELQNT